MVRVTARARHASLRLLLVTLIALAASLVAAVAPAGAAVPFTDVPLADPAYVAIDQLYNRGVIKGYPTTPPTFGPNDTSMRSQMAAMIGRQAGYKFGYPNPFQDRCNAAGCVDDELWNWVAALAARGVAKGYAPATFGPFDNVLKQQVILFITRAKIDTGAWKRQADNPRIYPGSAGSLSDHEEIVTYVFYAGIPPDAQRVFDAAWTEANTAATRGWFARALWQAFPEGKGLPMQEFVQPNPNPLPNTAAFAAKVLELTNVERQKFGCGQLTASLQLQNAAQKHAYDMATKDYFSHTGLNGSTPAQRISAEGYKYLTWAENIAAGDATPESVVQSWMNSTGHRANILNCTLQELGVGYYYLAPDLGAVNFNHYWVQVFGTPAPPAP